MSRFAFVIALLCGCGERKEAPELPPVAPPEAPPSPVWPQAGAPLAPPPVVVPPGFEVRQVYVDAGHGAPSNSGAVGAYCQVEEVFTLEAARLLADHLRQTGAFEVKVSRDAESRPTYPARVAEADGWADVLISLHFDARLAASASTWSPTPAETCRYNEGEHGFSVLFTDDGPEALVGARRSLARALASSLTRAGFPPYQGVDYVGLYESDPARPGAWVDRHEPGKRIFLLRAPQVPSVIVETHQALDREEALRWRERGTHQAFGAAVAAALIDWFGGGEEASR